MARKATWILTITAGCLLALGSFRALYPYDKSSPASLASRSPINPAMLRLPPVEAPETHTESTAPKVPLDEIERDATKMIRLPAVEEALPLTPPQQEAPSSADDPGDLPAADGLRPTGDQPAITESGSDAAEIGRSHPAYGTAPPPATAANPAELPLAEHPAWWTGEVSRAFRPSSGNTEIDVESLVLQALEFSPRVQAISETPLIQETAIVEAQAAFDVRSFMESKYSQTSDPVGNTLTTGGPPRLREGNWNYNAGLRKKTSTGASVELSQRMGLQDSNSVFFVPANQGNSRLSLSFNQPLLNGAGRAYNRTLTVLAEIEASVAWDRTSRELQEHLLQVTQAYWELYLQRAALLQKQRLLDEAYEILEELKHRRIVDVMDSQVVRARAAVAAREAELVRAAASIRNAEARIRALVNAPQMRSQRDLELIPLEPPMPTPLQIELRDAVTTALQNRPEIDEAMNHVRAASLRLDMAQNELLPVLNVVVESYVSGLRGSQDIGGSLVDQFSRGEPSYSAGLVFEVPWYNRAAQARQQRRELELRQVREKFQMAVENLVAEVEIAVREVQTAYQEMEAKRRSMAAAAAEVDYMRQRWRLLSGDDRAASFLLEDLLAAQERVTSEEAGFVQAQVSYAVAVAELKRVTGTLLQYEQIVPQRVLEGAIPRLTFERGAEVTGSGPVEPLLEPIETGSTPEASVLPGPK